MKTSRFQMAALALVVANVLMVAGCDASSASPAQDAGNDDPLTYKPAPDVQQLPPPAAQISDASATAASTVAVPGEEKPLPVQPQVSPALADVVKLVQSGVGQDVVLAYIQRSSSPFSIGAPQMNYLNDLGVPNELALAMIQHDYALAPQTPPSAVISSETATATPSVAPQPVVATTDAGPDQVGPAAPDNQPVVEVEEPPPVSDDYFYGSLSPYGSWVDVEGYGRCWQPTVVLYQSNWQPYCDNGHWVFSNHGWYWVSDYSWGATFHYGRWFRHPQRGWCWAPDSAWAPAWVTWRANAGYCGWAPLPPRTAFVAGVGLTFNGGAVGVGFGFGLAADCYTFVPRDHFIDRRPRQFALGHDRVATVINHTTVVNNFRGDDHHHIVNGGIAPSSIPTHGVGHNNGRPHQGSGGTANNPVVMGAPQHNDHPQSTPGEGHNGNGGRPSWPAGNGSTTVTGGSQAGNQTPHVQQPGHAGENLPIRPEPTHPTTHPVVTSPTPGKVNVPTHNQPVVSQPVPRPYTPVVTPQPNVPVHQSPVPQRPVVQHGFGSPVSSVPSTRPVVVAPQPVISQPQYVRPQIAPIPTRVPQQQPQRQVVAPHYEPAPAPAPAPASGNNNRGQGNNSKNWKN